MKRLAEIRAEYGSLSEKIQALRDLVNKENRAMTETERSDFKTWSDRQDELRPEIEQLANLESRAAEKIAAIPGPESGKKPSEEEKEVRKYSLLNVIRAKTNGETLTGREGEFAQMVALRNRDNGTAVGNYGVPVEVFLPKRDYTATGTTTESLDQGGQLIETSKPGLIEALNPYMIIDQLGVRKITNLKGNLELPKELSAPSATFKAETTAAASQAGLFDTVPLSPKRLPGYINYTHQMLIQPNLAMESYVRERLLKSIANAVQLNFFVGTGTSNAPTGILTTILATGFAGVGGRVIESANSIDWDSIVKMETLVDESDALMGQLKYVSNARMRGKLKSTVQSSSTNAQYLWNQVDVSNPVNNYPFLVTNQIPNTSTGTEMTGGTATPIIFGNWDDAILANWGDVFFDTVNANAASGYYQLVVNTFWDVACVRNESFSMIADVVTTPYYGS